MSKIPYNEVVEVEQELITEGVLDDKEVLKFCDIHTEALEEPLIKPALRKFRGHPVDTFSRENKELLKVVGQLKELFKKAGELESDNRKHLILPK
ncbi:MAG: DUF438 domain-containing protein [Bacteroidales bacterium]